MKRSMTVIMALTAIALTGCAPAAASQDHEERVFGEVLEQTETHPEVIREMLLAKQAEKRQQEQQEAECDQVWEENESREWYSEPYSASPDYGNGFKQEGVVEENGNSYSWYSQRTLPGEGLHELNANGRHVDESTGFVVDGDGYIAVASPWGQDPKGTVVDTPFGQGKVYDENNGDSYDLYTDF